MKYNNSNLKKVEELLAELSFQVRYGRGNFQSGYCLLDEKNIIVVNQFFDTEARMNCLFDVLKTLEIKEEELTAAAQRVWKKIKPLLEPTTETETEKKT